MQGVEGQIFSPMARTYGYALVGALLATFTVTPVLASLLLPEHIEEVETIVVRALRYALYAGAALVVVPHPRITVAIGLVFLVGHRAAGAAARQRIPAGARGRQSVDSRVDAADDIARSRHADGHTKDARNSAAPSGSHHRRVAAWPARQRQRRLALLQCRVVRAAKAVRRMAAGPDQGKADRRIAEGVRQRIRRASNFNFSQYIQDNVEEGLSGVKGANSVKIIGREPRNSGAARRRRS